MLSFGIEHLDFYHVHMHACVIEHFIGKCCCYNFIDELERKRKFHEERGEKGPGRPDCVCER